MEQNEAQKNCLACDSPLKGRSDKKFCDDYCRNSYNNQLKAITTNQVRNVNNALSKNRRILESFLPEGEKGIKVSQEELLHKGFLFKYVTHIESSRSGKTYYYCYDLGYAPIGNELYQLVRKKRQD